LNQGKKTIAITETVFFSMK